MDFIKTHLCSFVLLLFFLMFSDCSNDYQQIATEFQRKFPAQTVRDIREKRLAEVIKQRLIDCDHKSRNNHWQNMITLLAKIKISRR